MNGDTSTPEAFANYVVPNYGRFALMPERGQGSWLWDTRGKRYLDFSAGVAVCALGHAHPRMVKALETQAATLMHCSNLFQPPHQTRLAKMLAEQVVRAPGKSFFCNSGAEANEVLYKLARRFGNKFPKDGRTRPEIITFTNAFHGRTLAGLAANGKDSFREGFEPTVQGFRRLPFNDTVALRKSILPETSAILVEAVQGEGGIHVASREFLLTIAEVCREHDLLLMVDEVQSGLGRTGHLRGYQSALGADPESLGFRPDAVSWAKGLGGGFPIGAVWISAERKLPDGGALCDLLGPGSHGCTFGGSPLACSVALTVLEEVIDAKLPAHAAELGDWIKGQVKAAPLPYIRDVRGLGLLLGLVLDVDAIKALPACQGSPSRLVAEKLLAAGLLAVPAGDDVIRLLPPLNATREEAETALYLTRNTLTKLGLP